MKFQLQVIVLNPTDFYIWQIREVNFKSSASDLLEVLFCFNHMNR